MKMFTLFLLIFLIVPLGAAASDFTMLVSSYEDEVVCRQGEESMNLAKNARHRFTERVEIITKEKGQALLEYPGEAKFRIHPDSLVQAEHNAVSIKSGNAWMRFTRRGSTFQIKTPNAVLGIRGTTFRIQVDKANISTIDLMEGRLAVYSEGQNFIFTAGQRVVCRPGYAPQLVLVPEDVQMAGDEFGSEVPVGGLQLQLIESKLQDGSMK